MIMFPIHRIKIIHGILKREDQASFDKSLLMLKHDWFYDEIIRPVRVIRTDRQNKYYWSVVVDYIARQIGETDKNAVHKSLAMQFIGYEQNMIGGVEFATVPSTANLSTVEFTEYIETVRRWAAEFLNLNIPDPKKVDH
jgi:hypothetical protein